jgi:hypothetical protein
MWKNAKALLSNDTPEKAQAWLKEHGLEFSIEELNAICDTLKGVAEGTVNIDDLRNEADRELSDDELESAAGGSATVTLAGMAIVAAGAAVIKILESIEWPSW